MLSEVLPVIQFSAIFVAFLASYAACLEWLMPNDPHRFF